MKTWNRKFVLVCGLLMLGAMLSVRWAEAASYRVLVVMSYDEEYPFEAEMREGISAALAETCELKYVYLDTKRDLAGGLQKAQEAYAVYQEFRPDGVIAADDNAQSMFVVPYLKNRVETPVMFCGVNADPEEYGYPASNVSGILERSHFRETIAFVKQLVPSVKTYGRMIKDSPTANVSWQRNMEDIRMAGLELVSDQRPRTVQEALKMIEQLNKACDVIEITSLQGILDKNGQPLTNKEAIGLVANLAEKPTISSTFTDVKHGVLCAVIQIGQEQGHTAADMLLKAMQGTPLSELPITRNKFGRRILNVDVMKALGIHPKPAIIRSAELVTTEP